MCSIQLSELGRKEKKSTKFNVSDFVDTKIEFQ